MLYDVHYLCIYDVKLFIDMYISTCTSTCTLYMEIPLAIRDIIHCIYNV